MNLYEYYQIFSNSCYFNNIEKNYNMIFIHDLKDWFVKQLYNLINLNTKSQFDLLFSINKKYPPFHGSYFVIKINTSNEHTLISFILKCIERIPIKSKIG